MWLGKTSITLAGAAPLPYVYRMTEYAKEVNLMGIKDQIGLATLPGEVPGIVPRIKQRGSFCTSMCQF